MIHRQAEFKDRLSEAMEIRQFKAIDLADKLKVSRSTISQYLSGKVVPKRDRLVEISNILTVNPTWLMGLDVPMDNIVPAHLQHAYVDELNKLSQNNYYSYDDAAQIAQEIFDNKDLRILFDAAKDSRPEDLQMAADMLKRFKETNLDG